MSKAIDVRSALELMYAQFRGKKVVIDVSGIVIYRDSGDVINVAMLFDNATGHIYHQPGADIWSARKVNPNMHPTAGSIKDYLVDPQYFIESDVHITLSNIAAMLKGRITIDDVLRSGTQYQNQDAMTGAEAGIGEGVGAAGAAADSGVNVPSSVTEEQEVSGGVGAAGAAADSGVTLSSSDDDSAPADLGDELPLQPTSGTGDGSSAESAFETPEWLRSLGDNTTAAPESVAVAGSVNCIESDA